MPADPGMEGGAPDKYDVMLSILMGFGCLHDIDTGNPTIALGTITRQAGPVPHFGQCVILHGAL